MLEAREITYSFPHQTPLFENFSLAVERGERLALEAPSGFGKTALCRLLAGYLQPQKGEVLLDGKPLPKRGCSPVQLVWQHPEAAFDPRMRMGTHGDGSRVFLHNTREPSPCVPNVPNMLERLGIKQEWLTRFPHELSGGELQRFCIARALAANPQYFIADEMSTMLDAVTQARIWHFLLEECEAHNLGLIFVSHSPALTKRIATRVLKL